MTERPVLAPVLALLSPEFPPCLCSHTLPLDHAVTHTYTHTHTHPHTHTTPPTTNAHTHPHTHTHIHSHTSRHPYRASPVKGSLLQWDERQGWGSVCHTSEFPV